MMKTVVLKIVHWHFMYLRNVCTKLEFIFSLHSGLTETVDVDKNEHLCNEVFKKGRDARLWIHYFS